MIFSILLKHFYYLVLSVCFIICDCIQLSWMCYHSYMTHVPCIFITLTHPTSHLVSVSVFVIIFARKRLWSLFIISLFMIPIVGYRAKVNRLASIYIICIWFEALTLARGNYILNTIYVFRETTSTSGKWCEPNTGTGITSPRTTMWTNAQKSYEKYLAKNFDGVRFRMIRWGWAMQIL